MLGKYLLSALAVAGVAMGILAAVRSASNLAPAPMAAEAPTPPYQTFVAGAGLVEANSENIAIGTQISGIVAKVHVHIGSEVEIGTPLFTIDNRSTLALLATQLAAVKVAESQLAQAKYEQQLGTDLINRHVISKEDAELRRYKTDTAAAQLAQAQAQAKATETELERLTVRAPISGEILQLKIHPGEFVPTATLSPPALLIGNVNPLNVRVDIDENEAWRVRAGAAAVGYLRGNKEIQTPLKFVRFEPYVIPKVSLTGASTERVDTRVMQVIYSFSKGTLPIKPGQQLDIYIDAPPHPGGRQPRQ